MDNPNADIMASTLLTDNSSVLSAVASLLSRQDENAKDRDESMTTPLLVLTNMPGNDSLLANVILSAAQSKAGKAKARAANSQETQMPSFEEVHALATANLVASTQQDIAKQLAEASTVTDETSSHKNSDRKEKKDGDKGVSSKRKPEDKKKTENTKAQPKSVLEPAKISIASPRQTGPPELKALVCSFEGCNRKFAWQNHLKYHELTHTNDRQFRCPDQSCGKTFFTAQRLNVHLRIHTGEKPFKCTHQDCGKTFTTAGNLKNHQRIHTGEQPFVCDHLNCNRRFTEHSSLKKHRLTHSGDKPFECKICGKKFTQSGSRRQHLIRHHLDDEIRQSFKQEQSQRDGEEEEQFSEDRTKVPNTTSRSNNHHAQMTMQPSTMETVSCSPQVLVLNNAYHGLPTSESIVFSHGLTDHIVTVTTQSVDHPISDSDGIPLPHTLLSTEVSHEEGLQEKSDDLVVLSEAPLYQREDHPVDTVYAADILDHEEVTHSDYVSSQVDYTRVITHRDYTQHNGLAESTGCSHQPLCSSDLKTETVDSGDGSTECIPHVSDYQYRDSVDPKRVCHTFLDPERDTAQEEFIGAEEVTISQYPSIPVTSDLITSATMTSEGLHSSVSSQQLMLPQFKQSTEDMPQEMEELMHSNYANHPSRHSDLSYITSSSAVDGGHSVSVAEVTSHVVTHNMGPCTGDRAIHMDPMMECDEEPEKQ